MTSGKDVLDPSNRGQILIALLSGGVNGFRFLFSPTYRDRVLRLGTRKPGTVGTHLVVMATGFLLYVAMIVLFVLFLTHA
jgi:hypothetical protein